MPPSLIIEDTTSPTTTSDARATYYQGAVINLTAADAGTFGVKNTFYRLNDGPVLSGTRVGIAATSGEISYTLAFWSEDWAGNIEPQHVVEFTVISGTGTILLVWGDSDVSGSPCTGDPEADASWTIMRRSLPRTVASGSGGCPDWSGVNSIVVPVSPSPYQVISRLVGQFPNAGYYDQTAFSNVYVTEPGQIIRLTY